MSTDEPDKTGMPRSVADEIREIMEDLHADFGETILDTDTELEKELHELVTGVFKEHGTDGPAVIGTLKTMLMWMLLIGREHHARGYASPLPRGDDPGADVPDTIEDMFPDEAHDADDYDGE